MKISLLVNMNMMELFTKTRVRPGHEVMALFMMLNSAEHEIFSANKYESANNGWHSHIKYEQFFMLSFVQLEISCNIL